MTTTTGPTAAKPSPPTPGVLEMLIDASHHCLGSRIDATWGEFGARGRGLRFTKAGHARTGQVIGFISTLALFDRSIAEHYAASFVRNLDYLANYAGLIGDPKFRIPSYIVELGDDGTFGGFTIGWHKAVPQEDWDTVPAAKLIDRFGNRHFAPFYKHVYAMNGALIFHGPHDGYGTTGSAPTMAVSLKLCDGWSCHT